jgi:hypothetical protein
MELEKVNRTEAMRKDVEREKPSGVSTFEKKEEKTYVRRYAMSQGKRRMWLENHMPGDEMDIMFPSTRKYRSDENANDPERREKAKLLIACLVVGLVLILLYPLASFTMSQLVVEDVRLEGSDSYAVEEILDAAGISLGERLPMLSEEDAEARLLASMPYIKSCDITVKLPNSLIINIEEDFAVAMTELFGEYYALSSEMKVLERAESAEAFKGLIYIELPFAKRAVVGEPLKFDEGEDGDYIKSFLKLLKDSELSGRVSRIYFEKKFDIVASIDGKFRVLFGSPADMSLKLLAVTKMIDENVDKCGESSIIDVRVVEIAGIVLDAGIDPEARE